MSRWLSDEQAALVALVLIGVIAWLSPGAKDVLVPIASGIVGWMSKSPPKECAG